MESWKPIEYDGVPFIVSSLGNIKVAARDVTYSRIRLGVEQTMTKHIPEQSYTPQIHHTGYLGIDMRTNSRRVRVLAHRLVALAHCPGFKDGLTVNHINGNKTDNRAVNLEWVSLARNTQHAWQSGLIRLKGEQQPTHKLTSKQVVYIRKLLREGVSAHTLAVIAGVSEGAIYLIRDGKRWKGIE